MEDINKEKIMLLDLGEKGFVMGYKVEYANIEPTNNIFLRTPKKVIIQQDPMTRQTRIGFAPYDMFAIKPKEVHEIQRCWIVVENDEDNLDAELTKAYQSAVSGIKLASGADIIGVKL